VALAQQHEQDESEAVNSPAPVQKAAMIPASSATRPNHERADRVPPSRHRR
jgi:hypothetical protein